MIHTSVGIESIITGHHMLLCEWISYQIRYQKSSQIFSQESYLSGKSPVEL